jgi:hypothetical protein
MRYLGWKVMARFIGPIVLAFNSWRDEEKWHRRYCPTCGFVCRQWRSLSLKSMGIGVTCRAVACGRVGGMAERCVRSCETDPTQRLSVVSVEG